MKLQKTNKFLYYVKGYARFMPPYLSSEKKITILERKISAEQKKKARERVSYYCASRYKKSDIASELEIRHLKKPKTPKAYYFDCFEYARYFDLSLPIRFEFGDVTHIPNAPSIVKSRPITSENKNSVVLNLDKARHFVWVKNDIPFSQKKNELIGRCSIFKNQQNRITFFQKYFDHSLCDLGKVNDNGIFPEWNKAKTSLQEHLQYKFILSLQGNDVATNLKWIMSSNSIAVMPKPTMETWFMEGKLVANHHYIEIKEDFSDLESVLSYYLEHPEKCEEIVKNANTFCTQFWDKNLEDYCSFLVLTNYLGR